MLETIVGTVVGIIVGGVITWCVSQKYYVKSSKELKDEAERLRSVVDLIHRRLDNSGAKIESFVGNDGHVTSAFVAAVGKASGSSSVLGRSK